MNHPNVVIELEGVDHPEGVSPFLDRQFPYARTQPGHGLGDFRRVTLGNRRERVGHLVLRVLGKAAELFERALDPRDVTQGFSMHWRQCSHFSRSEEHTSELQSLMRISY